MDGDSLEMYSRMHGVESLLEDTDTRISVGFIVQHESCYAIFCTYVKDIFISIPMLIKQINVIATILKTPYGSMVQTPFNLLNFSVRVL